MFSVIRTACGPTVVRRFDKGCVVFYDPLSTVYLRRILNTLLKMQWCRLRDELLDYELGKDSTTSFWSGKMRSITDNPTWIKCRQEPSENEIVTRNPCRLIESN